MEAVADAERKDAEKMIAQVKPGESMHRCRGTAERREVPICKGVKVLSKFDRKTLEFMAEAVRAKDTYL